jgi:hypothetical protein
MKESVVMKKVLILSVLLFVIVSVSSFSWGVGASIGVQPLGGLPGSNVMFSFKLDQLPILFGVGFTIWEDVFNFGITADWWLVNENLFSFVNFYLGPGAYLGIGGTVNIGARLAAGLNIFPIDFLEIFFEIAPSLGLGINPIVFPVFGLQGAIGVRFWFN